MVVKVEAEPAKVPASDSLNINLTVSPPATNIYIFYLTFLKHRTDFNQKGYWYLSPKTGWSRNTLAKLVESFIPYIAAEAVFRFPKIS